MRIQKITDSEFRRLLEEPLEGPVVLTYLLQGNKDGTKGIWRRDFNHGVLTHHTSPWKYLFQKVLPVYNCVLAPPPPPPPPPRLKDECAGEGRPTCNCLVCLRALGSVLWACSSEGQGVKCDEISPRNLSILFLVPFSVLNWICAFISKTSFGNVFTEFEMQQLPCHTLSSDSSQRGMENRPLASMHPTLRGSFFHLLFV